MKRPWDVIVIGLGAMGAATIDRLARAGQRVLGIEQFTRGHDRGSSHGGSRVVRWTYFEHPSYVPLLLRARELWEDLEEVSRERLVHACGVLYAGDPGGAVIRGVRSTANAHDLQLVDFEPDEVRRRFPQFRIPEGLAVSWEPDAGFVRPEAAILAMLRRAQGHGAVIQEGERVESITERRGGVVVVESEVEEYEAKSAVVTAGPWCGRFAQEYGASLRPTRQVLAWIDPGPRAAMAEEAHCPAWFIEDGERGAFYGIPTAIRPPGAPEEVFPIGAKVARHVPGRTIDPDAPCEAPNDSETADLVDAMERLVPGAAGSASGATTCKYTMTPDGNFIIDSLRGSSRIFVACGFSGHGFKFAPVIGEILAGMATGNGPGFDIDFLRYDRLSR